jgi:hypothetical protein
LRRSWRTRQRIITIMGITCITLAITHFTITRMRTQLPRIAIRLDASMRRIAIKFMSTTSIADIPMVPSPRNSPVPAAGGGVSVRF